ncbi:MAG: T9SS type A sorting domain-containing protein [Candidatus Krumholzibacteriota bacterium]|nr:T9SS type A sorting domain-containing protein [Candidatus Krumholzibacteriota bacterium]
MPDRNFYKILMISATLLILGSIAFTSPAFAGREEETQKERIDRINREIEERGGHWTAGATTVGSLPYEQRQKLNGFIPPTAEEWEQMPLRVIAESTDLPVYFDWRGNSGVTVAKNQGSCGSCWAFAAVGQLEAHARIYDQRILDLSEQAVVDCDTPESDCTGGYLYEAYDLFQARGAVHESCMPYQATDGLPCVMDGCEKLAEIDGYWAISSTVLQIKQAIYDYGPVACGMFAHDDLSSYNSGCYDNDYPDDPNHGVLLVGWDDYACGGAGAWIMKNSWGTDWGTDGFGYIQYGVSSIGVFPYQIDYHPSAVYVHISAPNGSQELDVGSSYEITWALGRETPDAVSILLSFDSGINYDSTIAGGLSGTTESYMWTVPNTPVNTARVKVIAWIGGEIGGYDESDADFTIVGPPYKYVSPNGADYYPYSIPAWAANDIQDAIDGADDYDSIMVEGGYTYSGAINVSGKAVHLIGGWNSSFTVQDPDLYASTLQGTGSIVSFMNTASLPCGIEGFNIINGSGTFVSLPNLGLYGGGVFTYNASPTIKNNTIFNCGYTTSSQLSCGGGIACYNGTATITGNSITESSAQCGGGIYLYQATGIISGNTISGAAPDPAYSGSKKGGGIYALHSDLTISGNVIESNTGYLEGGGIYSRLSSLSTSGDSIRSNQSNNGGGIYSDHSSLTVDKSCISANNSSMSGGGIWHKAETMTLSHSVFSSNISSGFAGGIYADSCWGNWTNNTIDGNNSSYAGNAFVIAAGPTDIRNNNITSGFPSGFDCVPANITFQYNNSFGNNGADVLTLVPDTTNLSSDPLYADNVSGDYYPGLHSPCIDAGDPAILDPDGLRSDIGAFGGPGASVDAPAYVENLLATALNDTTIELTWNEGVGDGLDYFAIYSDTSSNFVPGLANYIGSSPAAGTSFQHKPVSGCKYYRVNLIDLRGHAGGYSNEADECASGTTTGDDEIPVLGNYLRQNYPNPFNPNTRISFSISSSSAVSLRIYDVSGRLVKTLLNKQLAAGVYNENWNGTDESGNLAASGVYFYSLVSKEFSRTRKMILLR